MAFVSCEISALPRHDSWVAGRRSSKNLELDQSMQPSSPPASGRSQERSSVRILRFLPVLALSGFAACGGSSTGGGQSGIPGEFLEKPSGDGVLIVDENQSGGARRFHIAELSWGRLVTVHGLDANGDFNPEPVLRNFLIEEGIQSDGADYTLERNPITQEERLIIHEEATSPALVDLSDEFIELLEAASDELPSILIRDDDGTSAPPFTVVPRNACIAVRFDDCLDDDAAAAADLIETVQVFTGYPPVIPYPCRVIFDPHHGAIIGGQFHSTRVLVDLTVSEIEATEMIVPQPVNALGAPASVTNPSQPNVSIRIPTRIDLGSGQFEILTNLAGIPLTFDENVAFDPATPTRDVVRAFRSGNPAEPNNGFLLDRERPRVVGAWPLTIASATPNGTPEVDFLVDLDFSSPCQSTPLLGDFVLVDEVFLEVTDTSVPPNPDSLQVRARSNVADPDSLETDGLYLTTFDPALTLDNACWVSFTPPATTFPNGEVSSNAQAVLRFSEPMDPATVSPFENFLVVRGPSSLTGDSTADATTTVVGSVVPSSNLITFAFTPLVSFNHTNGTADEFHIEIAGPKDLAGNALQNVPPFANFTIDPNDPTVANGGFTLRFSSDDEYRSPDETGTAPHLDFRGQLFYDFARGIVKPRPVAFTGWPADRTNPVPGLMQAVTGGVFTPLNPLGARLQTVWRYCDFGWLVNDETKYNLDVIGLNWAPNGGQVLRDNFERFEIILGTSRYLPDEGIGTTGLVSPVSGLQAPPNLFDDNLLNDPLGQVRTVHNRNLGYLINPSDLFLSSSGTVMMPFPLNRGAGQDVTFTWRDTAVLAKGGTNGQGIPMVVEIRANLYPMGTSVGEFASGGQVPSFGLPLLMEFRCFPSNEGVGLNALDVSIAIPNTPVPVFRAFSAGGTNPSGQDVPKNPDLEATPTTVDSIFYIGQLDVVTRVNRAHSIWFDTGLTSPDFLEPLVEPTPDQQPSGTFAVLEFRGATGFSADANGSQFDSSRIDPYGQIDPGSATAHNGRTTWSSSIHQVDGARYLQLRISFLSNIQTGLNAELSAVGIAFTD